MERKKMPHVDECFLSANPNADSLLLQNNSIRILKNSTEAISESLPTTQGVCHSSTEVIIDKHSYHKQIATNLSSISPEAKLLQKSTIKETDCNEDKFNKVYTSKEAGKEGESSNIYGESSGGGISLIGSWAIRNISNVADMDSKPCLAISKGDAGKVAGSFNLGNVAESVRESEGGSIPWRFEAGTRFEIRLSHLVKLFCVWLVIMALAIVMFHSRIRALENERNELKDQLNKVMERIDALDAAYKDSVDEAEEDGEWDDKENDGGRERAKRSANTSPSRTVKNMQYPNFNSLNNGSATFDPIMDGWTTQAASGKIKGARAAYLQIDGVSVNIKKPRQVIGPWYLSDTGEDYEFGDLWYDNLALDTNGTSIIFQEDGLFLIYAQVFYQAQQLQNVGPNPMGYRVHLRKNKIYDNRQRHRKPTTIAECVPSFPTTIYQTCFTQVVWSVQAQDEIFLEHFTDSRPIIEAHSSGQTFLGIVRLA